MSRRNTKDSIVSAIKEEQEGNQAVFPTVSRSWGRRFRTQFSTLLWKNFLVSWRNGRATLLRFLAPLFFMLLLYLVQVANRADSSNAPYLVENSDPNVDAVTPIPACQDDLYPRSPCWDFVYTPNTSAAANAIVTLIRNSNPGRPIPESAVLGFASIADVNAWMLDHPEQTPGALHFNESLGPTAINFVLQQNTTTKFFRNKYQDPTFFWQVPVQVQTQQAMATYYWQQANGQPPTAQPPWAGWSVSTSMFAHPTTSDINIVGQAIGPFIFAANMFTFVLLLSAVVSERERGLRQALRTAGMLDSAFWLSWLCFEFLAALFFSLLLIAFGAAFQFGFFLKNSFALVFLLFFLFQAAMVSFGYLISTFISKTSTAINLGFVVFILGWILQSVVAFGFPYTPELIGRVPVVTVIFTLFPFVLLAKASTDLGAASADDNSLGISWGNRKDYCQNIPDPAEQAAIRAAQPDQYHNFDCVFPLTSVYACLVVEFFLYFLIAIYLDHVLPDENGVRKGKPWYFLTPSYWTGSAGPRKAGLDSRAVHTARGVRVLQAPLPPPSQRRSALGAVADEAQQAEAPPVDPDVLAEEERMRELQAHRTGSGDALALAADSINAAEVYGLQKVFGRRACCACCGQSRCCACFAGRCGWLASIGRWLGAALLACCCCWGRARRLVRPKKQRGAALGEFWAVKGSWFAIERNRVFCLLGPNGAGKSTTINCLVGVLPPSGGDALVYGESITSPGGMDRIRAIMGVCPQFDVLWGELTGAEHMRLFGRIKGLPRKQLALQAAELLESVKLSGAARVRTVAYSGGMKRRLSVALALLGDPLILYLDEPTTGMDPISRRHVWDVIEASKKGRAIVLTTHSMEEADVLGDTIAIMCRGQLRCFGSSLRLKQRFGSGYQMSISVAPTAAGHGPVEELGGQRGSPLGTPPSAGKHVPRALSGASNGPGSPLGSPASGKGVPRLTSRLLSSRLAARADAVKAFFLEELGLTPVEETKAYMLFLLPKEAEPQLPGFLHRLEEQKQVLGITDTQISLTSLEEVFLSIARQAELEAAALEGRTEVQVELEEGGTIQISLGDQYVTDPASGRHYEVKYGYDDNGNLQVLRTVAIDALPSLQHSASRAANGSPAATDAPAVQEASR